MFELAIQSSVQTKRKKYCVIADQKREKIANLQIPRCTDFQSPPAPPAPPAQVLLALVGKYSDPNLTPLPSHPGIEYVARSQKPLLLHTDPALPKDVTQKMYIKKTRILS